MSKILLLIASFLGTLLKHIIPTLLAEGKKPRKTRVVGNDPDLQADIKNSIDGQTGRDTTPSE